MQGVAYYTKMLDITLIDVCRAPSFLMVLEYFSPNIAISGAVYSDSVSVDKLTTLSLLFQPNDYLAMTQLARTFKALKLALHGMKQYCTNLTTGLSNKEIKQLRFPHFKIFKMVALKT